MNKTITIILISFLLISSCKSTIGTFKESPKTPKDYALNFLIKEKIPGMAISVSKNGTIVWSEGFGYSNISKKTKVSPKTTQFRIASISKPITAVVLATLTDQGKVNVDASLYKYLQDYPKKQYDFTLRQVGGHTSGIRHYKEGEFILNKKMSITEGLNIFKYDSLLFKPQTDYKYSTYAWNLLSEVIQTVAKTPFETYTNNVLFKPLKMDDSVLDYCDSIMPNRTQFYRKTEDFKIKPATQVCNEFKAAGGGFLSTSEDLIKFGNEIISPKLISKASLKDLTEPQILNSGKSTNYGIGFSIGKTKRGTPKYGHSGGGIGASTLLLIYPEEHVVISILTNLSNVPIYNIGNQLEAIFIDRPSKN